MITFRLMLIKRNATIKKFGGQVTLVAIFPFSYQNKSFSPFGFRTCTLPCFCSYRLIPSSNIA